MKALLKRLGAPGARLNLGLQLFFAILFESVVLRVEFYVLGGWWCDEKGMKPNS